MKNALELLQSYQDNTQTPAAAALFAEDGVLELPTVKAHAQGRAAIESLLAGLLAKVPDFRFKDFKVWIDTPDKVFGEYSVEALVVDTGKVYQQARTVRWKSGGASISPFREMTARSRWCVQVLRRMKPPCSTCAERDLQQN